MPYTTEWIKTNPQLVCFNMLLTDDLSLVILTHKTEVNLKDITKQRILVKSSHTFMNDTLNKWKYVSSLCNSDTSNGFSKSKYDLASSNLLALMVQWAGKYWVHISVPAPTQRMFLNTQWVGVRPLHPLLSH